MRQEKLFGLDELTQEVTSSALAAFFATSTSGLSFLTQAALFVQVIDVVLNTPIKLSSGDEVSMFEAFAGGKILGYVGVYNGELIIVSPVVVFAADGPPG